MKFKLLINTEIIKICRKFRFRLAKPVNYPAHKCTVVGILTLMSRINFILSRDENEKSFKTLGHDPHFQTVYISIEAVCNIPEMSATFEILIFVLKFYEYKIIN